MEVFIIRPMLLLAVLVIACQTATAQRFDTSMAWPLCGHLWKTQPSATSCNSTRWGSGFADLPLSDGFTPRQKESENYRCDFHRGIDIPANVGSNVFAVTGGVLYKVENDSDTLANGTTLADGITIYIRHNRPGKGNCSTSAKVGQYYSVYQHLSTSLWPACSGFAACGNVNIAKGQKIGTTGSGWAGFAHLHFEIRDAPDYDSCSGQWQSDCIHPLRVLPYVPPADTPTLVVTSAVGTDLGFDSTIVAVNVSTKRLDLNKVTVLLANELGINVGTAQVANTSGYSAYNVLPNFYDIELWNRQWTHKDNSGIAPFSSFGIPNTCANGNSCSGANKCPYCEEHKCTYSDSVNVHVEKPCWDDNHSCCFNGIRASPAVFNNNSQYMTWTFTFNLSKLVTDDVRCIKALANAANGDLIATTLYDVTPNGCSHKGGGGAPPEDDIFVPPPPPPPAPPAPRRHRQPRRSPPPPPPRLRRPPPPPARHRRVPPPPPPKHH